MKNIRIALWSILGVLTALWVAANLPFPEITGFQSARNLFLQYSGVMAIGAMSVAMILAARAKWLEPWLNGLDKSYRLHKWLGIFALVAAPLHWVAAKGPKWAVQWGLMDRPERGGPPAGMPELPAIQEFLNSMRGTAEAVGEWAFYATVVLIALALIKRFPYKLFVSTHTLIAIAYLALVGHSIVLMNFDSWTQPLGVISGALMLGGVISAVLALTRQIGRSKRVHGLIDRIHSFPDMRVTEIDITLEDGWKGHDAGQFAFVTFDKREGKHPFTMASAWDPQTRKISFSTKALGDYTNLMADTLSIGGAAMVEGPYGRFTFHDTESRQIWIGGGIGITPFIARMKQLALMGNTGTIDLIHSTPKTSDEARALLTADAKAAGVRLHLMVDDRDGMLTGDRLREMVPDWNTASVWFCGPAAFGTSLRDDLAKNGLPSRRYHQELFNMR
ncbi:ferric reductase-like transmembrane domain-containing protein [Yoonia sp. I 8.24]|uniref:ferredoxin reductase family protein n=1 Tax=Yoonia sp. I 8.24 TaxID=1537229 RepID=UPI001EE08FE5|nr:ferric reductase-like transmembrane domain-containing protein [Yoonia sp. I 8.24]MCG3267931.1 ferric reductase-like transmembrane domain-containing protein [Yoonia sp. I 8.24]